MARLVPVIVGATTLFLAACNPYACNYETRFVGTGGAASGVTGNLTVQYVNFRDYSANGPVPASITWQANAERLSSPPKLLTLRDANDLLVANLSLQSSSTVSMTAAGSTDVAAADRDKIIALLASGRAQAVLELESGARIVVPLSVASQEDWHRPSCD
jgi:hypothetical protein